MKKVFLINNREKKVTNNKVQKKKKETESNGQKIKFRGTYSMNLQANVGKTVFRGENH